MVSLKKKKKRIMMQHNPENILSLYKLLIEKGFKSEEFNDYINKPNNARIFSYTGTDYKFRWFMFDESQYRVDYTPWRIEEPFDSKPFANSHRTVIETVKPWFNSWLAHLGNRLITEVELKKIRDRSKKTYFDATYFDEPLSFPERDIPLMQQCLLKLISIIEHSNISNDQKILAKVAIEKSSEDLYGMTRREWKVTFYSTLVGIVGTKGIDLLTGWLDQAFSNLNSSDVIHAMQTLHLLPSIPL